MFFVDAAHFVFGTFLCYLWSFTRIFVRAASGRQRFNVLGAWNAVTRQLIAVTNTTVVNTETMSELLRKIAALGLTGAITLVLDNARYQHNAAVKALASQLGITLLFLPSYSPNLNLIERLWKFTKRRALYGRYHPKFADFQAAIQEILDGIPTTYAEQLETLMTLNFQQFEDVSLMAAKKERRSCLNVTPAAASAELTIAASRISEKGRTFDCGSDLTFSEIHRRVAWGMVGLLAGIGIGSCNHQSFTFTQGGHICLSQVSEATYRFPSAIRVRGTIRCQFAIIREKML